MSPYDLCVVIPTYNEREESRAAMRRLTDDSAVGGSAERASRDGGGIPARWGLNLLVLHLSDGHRHLIPVEDVQGLRSATKEEIGEVEILGRGTGLHWPALDLDLYVPNLLKNIYGTRRWMAEMGARGGSAKSVAKREASRANGLKGGRPRKAMAS